MLKMFARQPALVARHSPLVFRHGQIALGFLVLMAFMLVLVSMTVNLGQMAQVRVETSNAADAGALAAASWIASGENEAAMVSRKMLDAIGMVQAIYLVPFCSGLAARTYANNLWKSLEIDPGGGQGPNAYFTDVANGAMFAAWNLAHREALTAMLNNMMMRFNTGPTQPGVMFGSLPEDIRSAQRINYSPSAGYGEGGLWWNNGLDTDDPQHLTHKSDYQLQASRLHAPSMQTANLRARYYQYRDREEMGFFDCDFTGHGITTTSGPVARLSRATLSDNPLAVDATGHKGWDINLYPIMPGINHTNPAMRITVGECRHTCGMTQPPLQTAPRRILPQSFQDGDGTITVTVSHEVLTWGGQRVDHGFTVPIWNTKFDPVGSRAVARYTSPNLAGAGFGVATPDAKASLEPGQER